MLWPLSPIEDVIATLEKRGIFNFDDLDDQHDEWTPEARAAHAVAQDDETGQTNPYLVTLALTEKKYAKVDCNSTIEEIAEW